MPRTQVIFAAEVADDFERILTHLNQFDFANVDGRIDNILTSLEVLRHSPLVGRPARGELRELVIGRDTHGYVALHQDAVEIDTVFVLGLKSQREAGYASEAH